MALTLDFDFCMKDNCNTLSITDTSGAYDASTNTTGWESPNLAGAAVTLATITITYDDDTTQVETVTTQIPSTVTGNFKFTDIDLSDSTDQAIKITYSVTDGTTTYTAEKTFLMDCAVTCCVHRKLYDKVKTADCECNEDYTYEMFLYLKLQAMKIAALGCDFAKAKTYLTQLQAICDATNDCGCT